MTAPRYDTTEHLGPVDACPGCGGRDFRVEQHDDSVVFRCVSCRTAWRYELGFVWSVDTSEPAVPKPAV